MSVIEELKITTYINAHDTYTVYRAYAEGYA